MRKALEGSRTRKKTRKQTNKPRPQVVAPDTPFMRTSGTRPPGGEPTRAASVPSPRPGVRPVLCGDGTPCAWREPCGGPHAARVAFPRFVGGARCGAPGTKVRKTASRLSLSLSRPVRDADARVATPTAEDSVPAFVSSRRQTPSPTRRPRRLRHDRCERPPPLAPEAPRRKPPSARVPNSDTIFSNRFAWY